MAKKKAAQKITPPSVTQLAIGIDIGGTGNMELLIAMAMCSLQVKCQPKNIKPLIHLLMSYMK